MKHLPREYDMQNLQFTLTINTPLQYGTHASRIRERVLEAICKELDKELQDAAIMCGGDELEGNVISVVVNRVDLSRETLHHVYTSRSHISPLEARRILRDAYGEHDITQVEEYIGEAEHQDGDDYWYNCLSAEDLLTDFRLFLNASLSFKEEEESEVIEDTTDHHFQ